MKCQFLNDWEIKKQRENLVEEYQETKNNTDLFNRLKAKVLIFLYKGGINLSLHRIEPNNIISKNRGEYSSFFYRLL